MNKIFIWTRWIDDVFLSTKPPVAQGGAELQMAFWAKLLAEKDQQVYTFSWRKNVKFKRIYNVKFLWLPWIKKIGVIWLPIKYLYLIYHRPELILIRSYQDLNVLVTLKKILRFRIIYMLASDKNVEISNDCLDKSWQRFLNHADGIIAQNEFQYKNICRILPEKKTKTIVIPNIFDSKFFNIKIEVRKYDFVWVGNIKKIKRISWFINLAQALPNYNFAIIGALHDKYDSLNLKDSLLKYQNLTYLGYIDVHKTTQIISTSKILVSTSETEGFPNTFLQAWSLGVPVISTVDPSDIIKNNYLGFSVNSIDELIQKATYLISSQEEYYLIQKEIEKYFKNHHSTDLGFKLITPLL